MRFMNIVKGIAEICKNLRFNCPILCRKISILRHKPSKTREVGLKNVEISILTCTNQVLLILCFIKAI